ncbi:hypothetical protein AAMO2058_001365000, partial [Amorphochlora amoebiformis]
MVDRTRGGGERRFKKANPATVMEALFGSSLWKVIPYVDIHVFFGVALVILEVPYASEIALSRSFSYARQGDINSIYRHYNTLHVGHLTLDSSPSWAQGRSHEASLLAQVCEVMNFDYDDISSASPTILRQLGPKSALSFRPVTRPYKQAV